MTTITTAPTQRPLIAGVLRTPVTRTLHGRSTAAPATAPRFAGPAHGPADGFSFAERDAVRRAIVDGRDTDERAIDHVVDRLLRELTW